MRRILLATLLSSITLTAAAAQATQTNDAATTSRPLSTGVTAAHLVYTTHMNIPASELPTTAGSSATVVLKVNLDETGTPTAISVLRPVTPELDARVVNAVRQFRWAPAVLDNKPVATDLTLTVEVQR
jgi:protein TonB